MLILLVLMCILISLSKQKQNASEKLNWIKIAEELK